MSAITKISFKPFILLFCDEKIYHFYTLLLSSSFSNTSANLRLTITRSPRLIRTRSPLTATKTFFPFLFGVYPYACHTEKQERAMELARVQVPRRSVYQLTAPAVEAMLRFFLPQQN